ncbi:MAG: hypothetical protein E7167_05635 [Firmicutes bacterium]|nr:hypothetical protein [Bacillota bacterium]
MKFTHPYADLSQVIKKFSYEGNYFHVEYFDGSISEYYCDDPKRCQEIKNKMFKQAQERGEKMKETEKDRLARTMILYFQIIFALGLESAIRNENEFAIFLSSLMIIINLPLEFNSIRTKIELKKYAMFFEMYNSLDEINKAEFMKCIEIEPLYQKVLDIDTVDDFTYGEIRTLYRRLMQEKN